MENLRKFVQARALPHLLFYGPAGTGKTSCAVALAAALFPGNPGSHRPFRASNVLELNASDDRGIDTVRDQIKTFASTKAFFDASNADGGFKIVILDEADSMTSVAQNALRRIMEKHVKTVRFILICNYAGPLIPALQSRCTRFRFGPVGTEAMQVKLQQIAAAEAVKIDPNALDTILALCADSGDMRRGINILQSAFTAVGPGGTIHRDTVFDVTALPRPEDIAAIYALLCKRSMPLEQACQSIAELQRERSIALADIVRELASAVIEDALLATGPKAYILVQLASLEKRTAVGCAGGIQLQSLVGFFHLACQ